MSHKQVFDTLGRAGFVARGVVYLVIGWIALMIALEHRAVEADRTGALELIAGKTMGFAVLWFLVVGFAGMTLWRATLALRPELPGKKGVGSRLASAGKAVLYAVAAYTTARFTVTGHASGSTNQQSTDFTTDLMRHSGGRWLVGAAGLGLVIGGVFMIKRGLERRFAKELRTGSPSGATRRRVLILGTVGNVARGVIAVGAGGFLVDAAIKFDPSKARGVDGTLRALATAPLGTVILIAMAFGLAAFGAYSFCEARWRRL
ncbi:DUF1206 domain-containing protein [Catenulispora sp. NF23]|uniref:DUF1206 domain-containing protein n=1 Tax=Catenulispora pinistramenti TaxID=2705254 RepID=A0ABS5KNG8_9ACTN|nr:DUF1206 domain-containing protein [Catenulispora pinistramenti]MBS2532645.1 DUF1206 domain-containing protein [Catenulispora pinistramenti]MBS2547598.1 DUF1206 domain-containing protein [Catenulispora pinistramenti]